MSIHYLNPLLSPRRLVVLGAESPSTAHHTLLQNLSAFKGEGCFVGQSEDACFPAYDTLREVAEPIDLCILDASALDLEAALNDCVEKRVRTVLVLTGRVTAAKYDEIIALMARYAGRNGLYCVAIKHFGFVRPLLQLCASFSTLPVAAGKLALITQSEALSAAILDWADAHDVGFSTVMAIPPPQDEALSDVLDFLAGDNDSTGVLLYISQIQQAPRFISALRALARVKPVVVLKADRFDKQLSATGIDPDQVFDAALQRAGVVRVEHFSQMFATARTLSARYRHYQGQLAIVSNGDSLSRLASDRANELHLSLARLSEDGEEQLKSALGETVSIDNPLNLRGDADAGRYRQAVEACLREKKVGGVLVLHSPQEDNHAEPIAEALIELASKSGKPILTCWMGKSRIQSSRKRFEQSKIPDFRSPEAAVEAFAWLATYHRNQQLLVQTPQVFCDQTPADVEGAHAIIESILSERRHKLSDMETKALLSAFRIPVVGTAIARTPSEALVLAESLGFPIAMKINSSEVSGKSKSSSERVDLDSAHAVRAAFKDILTNFEKHHPDIEVQGVTVERMHGKADGYELAAGIVRDPVFGPVLYLAMEHLSPALALPPLNVMLAEDLLTHAGLEEDFELHRDDLIQTLLRLSDIACELPTVQRLDINPLVIDKDGVIAVTGRASISYTSDENYDHMVIHPYPDKLIEVWQLPDGTDITIRPIRPEDAEMEQAFVRGLSKEARYYRFMSGLKELTPAMLARFTQIDYDREMALIAVTSQGDGEEMLGAARYHTNPDGRSCEFAVSVADAWQRHGLARKLMHNLIQAARQRGLKSMLGVVLSDNNKMKKFCRNLGFTIRPERSDPSIIIAERHL